MNNKQYIKWAGEVCKQEGYGKVFNLLKAYDIEILGC